MKAYRLIGVVFLLGLLSASCSTAGTSPETGGMCLDFSKTFSQPTEINNGLVVNGFKFFGSGSSYRVDLVKGLNVYGLLIRQNETVALIPSQTRPLYRFSFVPHDQRAMEAQPWTWVNNGGGPIDSITLARLPQDSLIEAGAYDPAAGALGFWGGQSTDDGLKGAVISICAYRGP